MPWATKRRFFILLIIGAIVVAFLTILITVSFYKTPSCGDGVQNQDETGVDCGGSCSYLCVEQQQSPVVLFTKAIQNETGRIDIVSYIENRNATAAAKNVSYKVTIYDANNRSVIQEMLGTIDLPPGTSIPVFIPGVSTEEKTVGKAFLEIDMPSIKWFYLSPNSRITPIVSNTTYGGTTFEPRIEAILINPGIITLTNVKVIVLVRNDTGDIITASSTIVPNIQAQGQATATFTWNEAFSSVPATIEVVPITPLP